jgi:hypothetical protein
VVKKRTGRESVIARSGFFARLPSVGENWPMTERRCAVSERRSVSRMSFVASVRQCVGDETQLALAQNLGERGMELRRRPGHAYLPRTPMLLAFELPDGGELVRVRASVTYERFDGSWQQTGVRFESISLSDRQRIARWLASRTEARRL